MVTITCHCAKKHDPVAVVYYRCELKGPTGQEYCTPHDGLYYVHNGVALANLPTKEGRARISHVAQWPVTNDVYVCGAEEAAYAMKNKGKLPCCGNTGGGSQGVWRPWVLEVIYTYAVGQPIAWPAHGDTHNGVFDCFQKEGTKECNTDITAAGGQGTLHYWHYVNPNPDTTQGEDGRTAISWDKFTLQRTSVTGDNIRLEPQPSTVLTPCDR